MKLFEIIIPILFIVSFLFSNITFAADDSVREEYYVINIRKLDSAEKEETEKQKKDEASEENTQAKSEHTSTSLSGKTVETMNNHTSYGDSSLKNLYGLMEKKKSFDNSARD